MITWIAPTIPVTSIDRAVAFYRELLGLEVAFTNGHPVGFVFADPDGNRIDVGQRLRTDDQ